MINIHSEKTIKNEHEPKKEIHHETESEIHKKAHNSENYNTVFVLSSIYLWVMFGFFNVGCDIGNFMQNNLVFRHIAGIISFFFLFSVINGSSIKTVYETWLYTILVYFMFLFLIKCNYYFSVPVILLLLIDQSFKIQKTYNESKSDKELARDFSTIRKSITILIYILIFTGFGQYMYQNKDKLNILEMIFNNVKCS